MKTVKALIIGLALVGAVALPGCCKKKCDKESKNSSCKKENKKTKNCKTKKSAADCK